MNPITDLACDGSTLTWKVNGEPHQIQLREKIDSAIVLRSGGIATIVGDSFDAQASILNNDGSLRAILRSPFGRNEGFSFYSLYYEGDHLLVVLASATRDFACRVDENTGQLSVPHETR